MSQKRPSQLAAFVMSGLSIVTGPARLYGATEISQPQCPSPGAPLHGLPSAGPARGGVVSGLLKHSEELNSINDNWMRTSR